MKNIITHNNNHHHRRMPVVGETILGTDFQMGFGGKGANQAVMAGILGNSVRPLPSTVLLNKALTYLAPPSDGYDYEDQSE